MMNLGFDRIIKLIVLISTIRKMKNDMSYDMNSCYSTCSIFLIKLLLLVRVRASLPSVHGFDMLLIVFKTVHLCRSTLRLLNTRCFVLN